jgi:hypothetical protein
MKVGTCIYNPASIIELYIQTVRKTPPCSIIENPIQRVGMKTPTLIHRDSCISQSILSTDDSVKILTRTKSSVTPTLVPREEDFRSKYPIRKTIRVVSLSQQSPTATKIIDAFWPFGRPSTLPDPGASPTTTNGP